MAASGKATGLGFATPRLRERPVRRLAQLLIGLIAYGVSMALMVEAHLGNQPWDVFHQGVARLTGLSFGTVTVVVGVVVLLLWIPLRQRPGIGTIANVVVIGVVADAALALLPAPDPLAVRIAFLVGAVLLCAVASGLYIGARLGPGPRDGLMTGLVARGYSLRIVRTGIEVSVVAIGWLLGGTLGVGTVVYAVAIGPLVHVLLPRLTVSVAPPAVTQRPVTQRPEESPDVLDEQVRLLQRGEVAAPRHIRPSPHPVAPLHHAARHHELRLAGEHGDAGGHLDAYPRR